MYELVYDGITGKVRSIKRLSDNTFIPLYERNMDYHDFLKWNKAQSKPLDLDSTIPVVPPVPVRDLAKEIDELKLRVDKL